MRSEDQTFVDGVLKKPRIMNNILEQIGGTPMVKLNRIPVEEGLQCEIVVKCDFFNAGGSIKDRIALRMIEEAELAGKLQPGISTIIEPTSGNTGIGLALAGAIKGYRVIIVLPEKMSDEKVNTLKGLGAEVIRTPTEAAFDSPESHIGVARRLEKEIPNSIILDQYGNPNNPLAHYYGTGEEIIQACGKHLDMIVIGAGTGGTLTGVGRRVKESFPDCIVVGVDPHGSILAAPDNLNEKIGLYQVEGIGYDFIPDVLDRNIVDFWIKTSDKESFLMARRLIRQEGLLCGGSSGAALVGAINAVKHYGLKKGQRCVVLLPDSVRNYMSKFLSDEWMRRCNFMSSLPSKDHFGENTVEDLNLPPPLTVSIDTTCRQVSHIMEKNGIEHLPIVNDSAVLVGYISAQYLLRHLKNGILPMDNPVSSIMLGADQLRPFLVTPTARLTDVATLLDKQPMALAVNDVAVAKRMTIHSIVNKRDLLHFLTSKALKIKPKSNE